MLYWINRIFLPDLIIVLFLINLIFSIIYKLYKKYALFVKNMK